MNHHRRQHTMRKRALHKLKKKPVRVRGKKKKERISYERSVSSYLDQRFSNEKVKFSRSCLSFVKYEQRRIYTR